MMRWRYLDRLTRFHLDKFKKSQELKHIHQDKLFEMFACYSVTYPHVDDEFDVQDMITDGSGDCGIDGLAVIIGGQLIQSKEQIEDVIKFNGRLYDVKLIFIQVKKQNKIDTAEMGNFGFGVYDIVSGENRLPQNKALHEKVTIINYLLDDCYDKIHNMSIHLYYVTLGMYNEADQNISAKINKYQNDLINLNFTSDVEFVCIDKKKINQYYKSATEKPSAEISLKEKVELPLTEGIEESYIGYISIDEFYKLLVDKKGLINKSIFFDNVRDYLGSKNKVNAKIAETLLSKQAQQFVMMNNGVTIVAKKMKKARGNQITLHDYQIVNGCQTSHVIFENYHIIKQIGNDSISIPLKLIVTEDEEIITNIIQATNSQTKVEDEQLLVLDRPFHKELEQHYETMKISDPKKCLYYERRKNQYSHENDIEKVRIVTIRKQIKAITAMFLEQPHMAAHYINRVIKNAETKLFKEDHSLEPYYTASYTLYKLEYFFRNGSIPKKYKKFRFHILLLFKYIIHENNKKKISLNAKGIEKYCNTINFKLWSNNHRVLTHFQKCIQILDQLIEGNDDSELPKRADFVQKMLQHVKG